MIYKKVIPLALRKNEYAVWKESTYKAIAGIENCQNSLVNELKGHLFRMLEQNEIVICIICRLPVIKNEMITNLFKNSTIQGIFEPKGNFLVKPGAVIALINNKQDIANIVEYWGTLDGIQFIFPITRGIDDLIKFVSTERYIYNKHSYDIWNELMTYAKVVITDTSTGKEFEMVYHKNDNLEMLLQISTTDTE